MRPQTFEAFIEDELRREYFGLLPELRRAAEELEARIRYLILPVTQSLDRYEQVVVRSRIKSCDSAIASLKRRQEGEFFDPGRDSSRWNGQIYSLLELPDLVGARVLAFPRSRLFEIDEIIRKDGTFACWRSDPVAGEHRKLVDFKYFGKGLEAAPRIGCEYQVLSLLLGLFWDVEHAAIYKPAPRLKGIAREPDVKTRLQAVYDSLQEFEEEFERQLRLADGGSLPKLEP